MIPNTPDKLEDVFKKTIPKVTESAANENYRAYVRARDNGHSDYVKLAAKCDRFYAGDQWEEADQQKLDAQGRPALTINMVRSTINVVLGEQITRRADMKFKNKRGGTEEVATLLSKLYQSIADDNDLDHVESMVFADGVIQDRGYFDVRIGFRENMQGEVEIRNLDPKDVLLDPDAKEYDPRTWSEVIVTSWMSLEEIAVTYGKEKAEKIKTQVNAGHWVADDSILFESSNFGDTRKRGDDLTEAAIEDRKIRRVRIIDRQYYKMTQAKYFVDTATGDSKPVPADWDDARVEEFAANFGLFLHRKMERKVYWVVSADTVALHEAWSPYSTFTVVPYFPFFRRGKPVGLVRDLINPQELLNKVSSQELHIINTTANSGYIVERGALANMTPDELKEKGSETGVVIETAPGRKDGVEKIKPNTIPTGLDRVGQKATNNFRMISGVNDAMLGLESPEVSGVAIEQKKQSGSSQLNIALANLRHTRKLLATKIMELVQNYYTEQRVLMVADQVHPDQPVEEVLMNEINAAGEIINDITIGEYDVIVTTAPARDTFEDSQFAELLALRNVGVQIPDDRVIERSSLEDKMELAEEVRGMTGRGKPSEEQLQMQAFQQDVMMQNAMLELAKLEAEVMEMKAKANKLMVEAGAIPQELEIQMAELEMQIQGKREELEIRRQTALLSSMTKVDIAKDQQTAKVRQMLLERRLGDTNIDG